MHCVSVESHRSHSLILGILRHSTLQYNVTLLVVRAFAHGAMGRRIDPSWGGPIELFLVPASAPRLV